MSISKVIFFYTFNSQALRCADVLFIVPKCFEVIADLKNQPNSRYVVIIVFVGTVRVCFLNIYEESIFEYSTELYAICLKSSKEHFVQEILKKIDIVIQMKYENMYDIKNKSNDQ